MTKKEYLTKYIAYCVISILCFFLFCFGFSVFTTGGAAIQYDKCYRCSGSGTYRYGECTTCDGFGIIASMRNIGAESGIVISFVGLGGVIFFATKGLTLRANKPSTWISESDTKENNKQPSREITSKMSNTPQQNGEWICTCGRCNPPYITSCVCGTNKRDVK